MILTHGLVCRRSKAVLAEMTEFGQEVRGNYGSAMALPWGCPGDAPGLLRRNVRLLCCFFDSRWMELRLYIPGYSGS